MTDDLQPPRGGAAGLWLLFCAVGGGAGLAFDLVLHPGRGFWLGAEPGARAVIGATVALFAVAAAVTFYPLIGWGVAPKVDQIWMSPKAAALVTKYKEPEDPPVVLGGYVEPSLVFLLGTNTQIQNGTRAANVAAQQGGLALIEDHEKVKFLTRLGQLDAIAKPLDGLSGFNYSRGRREHITVYRVTPTQQITEPPSE